MISVCLASYNGEKYIKEQLDSILSQIGTNDEIIVSDDGSTDGTLLIVNKIQDPRIKVIKNKLGKGYTSNFENALNHACGEIIFLSDQDDVWYDNKVSVMLKALEKSDFVVSNAMISDENLTPTLGSHFKMYNVKKGFLINWLKTRYVGACMAFNKKILTKALPFPSNHKLCAHDYWLTIIAEMFYKVTLIDTPLIKYRRHGANASTGGHKSTNSLSHKLKVRVYTFWQLLKRL